MKKDSIMKKEENESSEEILILPGIFPFDIILYIIKSLLNFIRNIWKEIPDDAKNKIIDVVIKEFEFIFRKLFKKLTSPPLK